MWLNLVRKVCLPRQVCSTYFFFFVEAEEGLTGTGMAITKDTTSKLISNVV